MAANRADPPLRKSASEYEPYAVPALSREEQKARRQSYVAIQALARHISPAYVASAPCGSAYLGVLMLDLWGHANLHRLSLEELAKLRDILQARATTPSQLGAATL